MENKVLAWCRAQALFSPGEHVVCAVSGGADSVALLHCLLRLRGELDITVSAAHFNHHLRGAESDRDEAFVRTLCQTFGVPLRVSGGDAAARAAQTGESIEEAARKLRYAFFESLGATVATAHTADDNLETVLLNLVRGTSLRGLCGIPPKRGVIVRPLLCAERADVEAFLRKNALCHVEDSTNAQNDALRNRLRHSVVPLLRQENPSISETVLRGSLLLREDESLLEQLAADALRRAERSGGWDCAALLSEPEAIRSRAVRRLLRTISAPKLTGAHIRAVCALLSSPSPSARVSLPGGWTASRRYALLCLQKSVPDAAWAPVRLNVPGLTRLPESGLCVSCQIEERLQKNQENENSPSTFVCKCDMMDKTPELWVRPRAPQDAMRVSGGHRTLKRLMIDRRIPAEARARLPVFFDADGILGVYGLGVNLDRAAHTADRALIVRISPMPE